MTTRRVKRAPGSGKRRLGCTSAVRVASDVTYERLRQEYRALLEGRPATVCGRPSYYLVDGRPRCAAHAAQEALRILMGEEGS